MKHLAIKSGATPTFRGMLLQSTAVWAVTDLLLSPVKQTFGVHLGLFPTLADAEARQNEIILSDRLWLEISGARKFETDPDGNQHLVALGYEDVEFGVVSGQLDFVSPALEAALEAAHWQGKPLSDDWKLIG